MVPVPSLHTVAFLWGDRVVTSGKESEVMKTDVYVVTRKSEVDWAKAKADPTIGVAETECSWCGEIVVFAPELMAEKQIESTNRGRTLNVVCVDCLSVDSFLAQWGDKDIPRA